MKLKDVYVLFEPSDRRRVDVVAKTIAPIKHRSLYGVKYNPICYDYSKSGLSPEAFLLHLHRMFIEWNAKPEQLNREFSKIDEFEQLSEIDLVVARTEEPMAVNEETLSREFAHNHPMTRGMEKALGLKKKDCAKDDERDRYLAETVAEGLAQELSHTVNGYSKNDRPKFTAIMLSKAIDASPELPQSFKTAFKEFFFQTDLVKSMVGSRA